MVFATAVAATADLQAVVLAGYGNRLYPLVDDTPSGLPKALLPVANKPLIAHTLAWLEANAFTDILVVANSHSAPRISHYLSRVWTPSSDATRIELISTDDYPGTLALLKGIRDKIRSDVFVCGCDIVSNAPLNQMLLEHRLQDAAMTALFFNLATGASFGSSSSNVIAKKETEMGTRRIGSATGRLQNDGSEDVDVVALDAATRRLLFCAGSIDADCEEAVTLPFELLLKHGTLAMRLDVRDAHAYLFKKSTFDAVCRLTGAFFYSLKEDAVPYVVRTFSPCIAHIVDDNSVCGRANTIGAYFELNKQCARFVADADRIAPSAALLPKGVVGSDCLVGDGTSIGERSSVKKSVIGANVRIGANVKIINCILMDGCVVDDGARLDASIVAFKAHIGARCCLKECDIGGSVHVAPDTSAKNEAFSEYDAEQL